MSYNETYTPDVFTDDTGQVIHDRHLNKIEEGIKKAYELINQLGQELEALKQVVQVVPSNVSAFSNDAGYVTQDTTTLEAYYLATQIDELLNNKANVTHTHDDLIATLYKLGVVKPDGDTIVISVDGTISVKRPVLLEYDASSNTLNIKTS